MDLKVVFEEYEKRVQDRLKEAEHDPSLFPLQIEFQCTDRESSVLFQIQDELPRSLYAAGLIPPVRVQDTGNTHTVKWILEINLRPQNVNTSMNDHDSSSSSSSVSSTASSTVAPATSSSSSPRKKRKRDDSSEYASDVAKGEGEEEGEGGDCLKENFDIDIVDHATVQRRIRKHYDLENACFQFTEENVLKRAAAATHEMTHDRVEYPVCTCYSELKYEVDTAFLTFEFKDGSGATTAYANTNANANANVNVIPNTNTNKNRTEEIQCILKRVNQRLNPHGWEVVVNKYRSDSNLHCVFVMLQPFHERFASIIQTQTKTQTHG